jgi:histidinol-phosphatase (PHP family)
MINYNLHTHSQFCDGKSSMEEMVQQAILLGYTHLGFSSHAPVPFETKWAVKQENMDAYFHEISRLQEKYATQIKLYKGLEVDFLASSPTRFDNFKQLPELDYTIGAVHIVGKFGNGEAFDVAGNVPRFAEGLKSIFNDNKRKFVETYFELLHQLIGQQPTIIAHIDFIKNHNQPYQLFDENAAWYRALMEKALYEIKQHNCILEINTRGYYKGRTTEFYPSEQFFPLIKKLDIPLIISSDAHHISELNAGVAEAELLLHKHGLHHHTIFI